jgi:succinoglycan biosynthesis transport protein ExoP
MPNGDGVFGARQAQDAAVVAVYTGTAVHGSDDATAGGFAQLAELLGAVRRRWVLVAVIVVAAGAAAFALTARRPKQYEAVAQVFISQSNPVSSVLSRTDARPPDPERDFNTRVALIKEPTVAERVRRRLALTLPIDTLLAKVSTEVTASSDIAGIRARDADPRTAAAIADAFAQEYVQVRQAAARGRVEQAVALAARQLASLSPADRASSTGQDLADRLRELQIDAQLQTSGVEVVGLARPPGSPAAPRPLLTTALAMLLAGLVGVALAVVLELGDRRLRDESDLDPFGAPLLGAVPPIGGDDVPVREALSTVATNLRFLHDRRRIDGLVVTAAARRDDTQPGVTLGLAGGLAQQGLSVIAIEADLRRPRMADLLGLPSTTGLSTVLAGFAALDDVLVTLDPDTLTPEPPGAIRPLPSCSVVVAGPVAPNPMAMLAGPAMAETVARARELADVVVVDTAPVATVGDALTLAGLVDGTILLAKLGETRHDALARALRTLEDVPTELLGVVLTNVPRQRRAYYDEQRGRRATRLVRP